MPTAARPRAGRQAHIQDDVGPPPRGGGAANQSKSGPDSEAQSSPQQGRELPGELCQQPGSSAGTCGARGPAYATDERSRATPRGRRTGDRIRPRGPPRACPPSQDGEGGAAAGRELGRDRPARGGLCAKKSGAEARTNAFEGTTAPEQQAEPGGAQATRHARGGHGKPRQRPQNARVPAGERRERGAPPKAARKPQPRERAEGRPAKKAIENAPARRRAASTDSRQTGPQDLAIEQHRPGAPEPARVRRTGRQPGWADTGGQHQRGPTTRPRARPQRPRAGQARQTGQAPTAGSGRAGFNGGTQSRGQARQRRAQRQARRQPAHGAGSCRRDGARNAGRKAAAAGGRDPAKNPGHEQAMRRHRRARGPTR